MICPNCGKEIEESPSAHLSEELERTERLAFTGRIAAGIAHEIRNPLTNLSMSVNQIKKVPKPRNPWSKHIEIIIRNTERINELISELLNCARPPKLDLHPCDIHKVMESVLDSASIRLHNIEVVKRFTEKSSIISIDKEQIEQALSNIVINAIDAMRDGGELTFDTERDDSSFFIKIQDTGKGIPEEDIMKIYDPFFSAKSGGIGLGLTLCYGIIVSHAGKIEVESKKNEGTTFTVSLPIDEKSRVKQVTF